MHSKTFVVVVLSGLLMGASCQQVPVYQNLEPELQEEKQFAEIGTALFGLVQPLFSTVLSGLTANLGTAIVNAITSAFAGKKLELIPIESLFGTPIKDSSAFYQSSDEPPKRRPYSRAMIYGTDKTPAVDQQSNSL